MIKPSTPLPWSIDMAIPGDLKDPSYLGKDHRYILHACNTYPELWAKNQELDGKLREAEAKIYDHESKMESMEKKLRVTDELV